VANLNSFLNITIHKLLFICFFLFCCISSSLSQADDSNSLGSCGDTQFKNYRSISAIQGSGFKSPLLNKWVVVEGIVTLDKTKEYQGFWLQQEASLYSNEGSITGHSQGIFIFQKKAKVKRGQRVRLLAQVAEYHNLTEFKRVKVLKTCARNQPVPAAVSLTLPVKSLAELEALEGMRISINQPLLVSDLFGTGYGLGNHGQFAVSSDLHFQPTELFTVQELRSGTAPVMDKKLDYLLVDDGHSALFPKFIPFPNSAGFSANNPLRIADGINQLSGVLHSYDEHYILIPDAASNIRIESHARSKQPKVSLQANLLIASMNLQNYFNGSPSSFKQRNVGFPTSRGAKSYSAFVLQTQKLISALAVINADVIAVMELENDGYGEHSSIADLTRALNEKFTAKQQYQYIVPKQRQLGNDEISTGILYRNKKLKSEGAAKVVDVGYSRPSLLQKFTLDKQSFYLAVNHFKSKGRPCKTEAEDVFQGHCNQARIRAALALTNFIKYEVEPESPVLIVGDLNSYSKEDPLLVLKEAGYKNLNSIASLNLAASKFSSNASFSYSYQGYLGNLDHALVNDAMLPFIRSIDHWHINSVEDELLNYQIEDNGQSYPSIDHYGSPDAYRSSDHDPLVIGIEF